MPPITQKADAKGFGLKSPLNLLFTQPISVFSVALVFRLFGAFCNRSYFIPDEVWQAHEVAHRFIFGYGYETWEWRRHLRSFLYPWLLSAGYWALHILRIDSSSSLDAWNRIFGATIGAGIDYWTWKMAGVLFERRIAALAIAFSLSNAFNFVHQSRTLINNFESLLVLIFYWHFEASMINRQRRYLAWACATVGMCVRPTFAINVLIPFLAYLVPDPSKNTTGHVISELLRMLPFGAAFLFTTAYIDRLYYGKFVLTWWNFAKFNVFDGLSSFFGEMHVLWYFWAAFPILTNVCSLLLLLACKFHRKIFVKNDLRVMRRYALFLVAPVTAFYTALSHKEVRFVVQLQPFFCVAAALTVVRLRDRMSALRNAKVWRAFWCAYAVVNVAVALHFSLVHQVGPQSTVETVQAIVRSNRIERPFVFYLTSCHATRYAAFYHDAKMRLEMVECDAPTSRAQLQNGAFLRDTDKMFRNPHAFVSKMLETWRKSGSQLPDVLVVEASVVQRPNVRLLLEDAGFVLVRQIAMSLMWLIGENKSHQDLLVFHRPSLNNSP